MKLHRLMTMAALTSGLLASPVVLAGEDENEDDDEIEFDVAEVFFELNNTDGDLGIHALIDGGPWRKLTIEDPRERKLLNAYVRSRLRRQGLTEIFFESAEPTFDELPPEVFFRRFPAGIYEVEGKTLDGLELESEAQITHAMPAPPEPTVNGLPMATQCDDEEPGFDITLTSAPVTISWPPVLRTHPSLGSPQNTPGIEIHNYQVVVEAEVERPDGEEFETVFSTVLPPEVRSLTVPAEFLAQTDTFKYEVLARETSFNQTAVESCFSFDAD